MQTKTIQQIKDEVARSITFKSWLDLEVELSNSKRFDYLSQCVNEVVERYTHQQCELQKAQCADEARLLLHDGRNKKDKTLSCKMYIIGAHHLKVSEQSILTAKNVCDAK